MKGKLKRSKKEGTISSGLSTETVFYPTYGSFVWQSRQITLVVIFMFTAI